MVAKWVSHPMRVRGLKLLTGLFSELPCVAPHAGAWIETIVPIVDVMTPRVAPHAGAWIETK